MAGYSEEFKYSIVSKMMPPQNRAVADIPKETGLSEVTLYKWQNLHRKCG
ncbi:MAG: transposase [Firmicutes bacterium]|nr:transposase [Bacillota bacterium]